MKRNHFHRLCVRYVAATFLAAVATTALAADPPLVHLLATDPQAAEQGGDPGTFTVIRTGPTGQPLTVHYRVAGTARHGVDYQSLSGSVTIPANASCAPIHVFPIDDTDVEGNETVVVGLNQPLNLPPPYIVCWPSVAAVGIEDNDVAANQPPRVQLINPPDESVFVGPVDITLVAKAWDVDGRVRTVEFFADGISLGKVISQPLILNPEPLEDVSLSLTRETYPDLYPDPAVDLEADLSVENIRGNLFRLLWEDVPAGSHFLTAVATDNRGATTTSAPVHIRVLSPPLQPVVNIVAVDPVGAEPGITANQLDTALFQVRRSGDLSLPLPVFYRIGGTAANGVDYREVPNMVVIPAGRRSADILIEPLDDRLVEGTESVVLRLSPPVCIDIFPPPPDCYQVGAQGVARAIIQDNDSDPVNLPPTVRIVQPQDGDVFMAPANLRLIADARDADGYVVAVEFFEGTNSLGKVSLDRNALDATKPPFVLPWLNVPPGHYVLTAEATDNRGATALSRPVEIKVTDRVPPPVVTVESPDPEAAEGRGIIGTDGSSALNTATFLIRRTGSTARPLDVYYTLEGTAKNGTDYHELSGRATIPVGASTVPIVIVPIDDQECEGTEAVVPTIQPPVCIAIALPPPDCYVVGDPYQTKIALRDNDICPGNLPPNVAIVRPQSGDGFEAPADISLVAEAKDPDGSVVSVEFFANNLSLGVVSSTDPAQELFRLLWSHVGPGAYALRAKATDNRSATAFSDPINIRVFERIHLPVVTVEATDPSATEGPLFIFPEDTPPLGSVEVQFSHWQSIRPPLLIDTATFTIARKGESNLPLTVYYRVSGTAANGDDYDRLTGEATIPAGSYKTFVRVFPIEDNLPEDTESVVVELLAPPCLPVLPPPPGCYLVGDPNRAVAYIKDNDLVNQKPKIDIVNPVAEQVFPALADIDIEVVARDPDGWVGLVEFFDGDKKIGEDSIVFIVAPPPGQVQKFSMTYSNVPPGRHVLTAKATDDRGGMSVSEPVPIKVLEACSLPLVTLTTPDPTAAEPPNSSSNLRDTATFRVCRSCRTDENLVVFFEIGGTAENGVDYRFLRGHVTIPAGAACADVIIDPEGDDLIEGTETVEVKLTPLDCLAADPAPAGCYVIGRENHGVAFIRDNDFPPNQPPKVAVISPPDGAVFVAPVDIRIAAEAHDGDGWVRTVEFFADGTSLGIVSNHPWILDPIRLPLAEVEGGPVIIPGPIPEPIPVPIPINPFSIVWANVPPGEHELTAKATDNAGASSTSQPIKIKVTEPSFEPVVTVVARDPLASEGCADPTVDCVDTATFVVHRTGTTDRALRVFYRLSGAALNGVDYEELPNSVLIPAGSSVAPVLIEPIDDSLVEGAEKVLISLVEPPFLDVEPIDVVSLESPIALGSYQLGRARTARAVIFDNDTPPNAPPLVRLIQPADGDIFRAPADIQLAATASDVDGQVVQVEFLEGDNSLGVVKVPELEPIPLDALADPSIRPIRPLFTLLWPDVPAGTYVLTAVATDDDGGESISEPVEIKVVDPQPLPVVNIETIDGIATEQSPLVDSIPDTGLFRITRQGGNIDRALAVFYRVGGTASNGKDYELLSGRVVIEPGKASADILINPIDDLECEGRESIRIGLVPHPCVAIFPPTRDCYTVGPQARARAVLRDDDICPPNQPPKVAIVRPQEGDVFKAPADILLCAEAKDADGKVVRVEFFAGNVSLGVVHLTTAAEPELFCLRWPNVPPGAYTLTAVATDDDGAATRSDPVHIRVIQRPGQPVITLEAADPVGSEDGDEAAFVVTRSCCIETPLSVYYALNGTAENGTDYERLSGEVTIPVGALSARIVVHPKDDSLVEGTETVIASLEPSNCEVRFCLIPCCYVIGHPSRDVVFIRDNESQPNLPPLIALLSPPEGSVFSAPADIDLLAVGLDPDGWIGMVEFFANQTKIGEVTINFIIAPPPGQLQTFDLDWADVPAGLYVLTAKATDSRGGSTVSGPIHIRVIDPCSVPVVTVHATDPFAAESGEPPSETATFVIRRSCSLNIPLLVNYTVGGTARNGDDYRTLSGQALIPAGQTDYPIVIYPIEDRLGEGVESVILVISPSPCVVLNSSSDPTALGCYYQIGVPGRATAFIRDNDNQPPRVVLVEPFHGQIFKAPASIPITAETSDPDGWVTQIQFFEGDNPIGGLAILVSEPPPPGQWQTFHFTWADVPVGEYELTARVTDNGGATADSLPIKVIVGQSDPPPMVVIEAIDAFALEGTENNALFRIRRSGSTQRDLAVHFRIGGTALNGIDYKSIASPVVIPSGRSSVLIEIDPVDDKAREGIETVMLDLRLPNPSPIPPPYQIGRPHAAAAVIVDSYLNAPLCQVLPDGLFYLCLPGFDGLGYRLEATDDLNGNRWEEVCTGIVFDGAIHFVDPDAPSHPRRFYRISPAQVTLEAN